MYPALAVLQTLEDDVDSVLWVGGEGGMEADMINRLGIPFKTIPAAGVHGVGIRALPGNILRLIHGIFASRNILTEFKPDGLLFTGGFVAVPMAIAGIKIPSLLFVPDIEPGLAIKAIARFSDAIALTAEESKAYFTFHRHTFVSGYPIRRDLSSWTRQQAKDHFGVHTNKPVVFIFGGSKGARSINQALYRILPELLIKAQVLHVTGQANFDEAQTVKTNLSAHADDYLPLAYLHEDMGAAFSAADLVVCRAGASTLGELPLFGLPAILVPYPYAWRYQKVNADYLVKNGGAFLLKDEALPSGLLPAINRVLDSPEMMESMQRSMKLLSRPEASKTLAETLFSLAGAHD
ncbi:MAG: UDP-N-acetylglucosamine--N-acetylmuramyl-(pentapeptide) pyrophosphoryl-undecaprenol N-acetylglucosamine transferase [Leptolinea sp.]|nr:UDP-N-acetylglucosamine--N-acetylmuramyl-(pentapeptide) pyrophosphoryl-undecaprenol N-acetylglucosamine transferase [Leptolinea sp.]